MPTTTGRAVRDRFEHGTGLPAASVAAVTIFSLRHCQQPQRRLAEARRSISPNGLLALTDWVWDASTPRGPDLSLRPRPEQLRDWAAAADFTATTAQPLALPPSHCGWVLQPTDCAAAGR